MQLKASKLEDAHIELRGSIYMPEANINFVKGKTVQKVDADFIKKELAQYLQIENLNFLIGSGCSSCFRDGHETAIPTMKSLYKDFFEENPDFSVGQKGLEPLFHDNLEKMLDFMISVRMVNYAYSIDDKIDAKITLVQKFIRQKIIDGLSSPDVLATYKEFYLKTIRKSRKTPINIFTTNYDLYNEKALDELCFFYNDGFTGTYNRKFNPMSYNYAYVEDMNLNKDIWERVPNFYNLYKIHGSITWVNNDEQIWEKDFKFIKETETVMIYPTPLKDRTTLMTPYSDLFRNMQSSLMRSNCLVITMGYGFSDDHINRIILNALAIPTFRLVVFGESDGINKLKSLGDKRIIIINSEDKIEYFNRIVEEIMPDIQEDVEETAQLLDGPEAIQLFEKGEVD